VRPESIDGISMTCSVAGDRYSWYAANKAKQFHWQHSWWYPQVIEMTPNVSGQTLSPDSSLELVESANLRFPAGRELGKGMWRHGQGD
jgi:hypothetical protein